MCRREGLLGLFGFLLFYRARPRGVFLRSGYDWWEGRWDGILCVFCVFKGLVSSSGEGGKRSYGIFFWWS